MAIHQKQVMTLQQKLSPQQIQMIKLLELPTVQLEQRIKQEIEENIVLEEAEQQNEEEEPQQISVDEYLREDDTPAYKMRANNYSKDDKPRQIPLSGGRSLQEYLIEQLGYRNLSEEEMRLAVYLVGSIDEDGYLRRDLESVADDIAFTLGEEVSPERLEAILKVIHDLEPAGIGARNLRECLLLQLSQLPMTTRSRRLARKILTSYFDEFAKKHYEKLISRLQVTEDEFRDAIAEIRHLSPKPANGYSDGGSDAAPYVVPDFILDYHDGRFELSLNSYNVPDVRINRRYVEMMRDMVSSDGRVQEKNREAVDGLLAELTIENEAENTEADIFAGMTFVITGSVQHFASRKELQAFIEARGGKATSSVTAKTTYLINNDVTSNSSKNKKAKELGIPIISEQDFLNMMGGENNAD